MASTPFSLRARKSGIVSAELMALYLNNLPARLERLVRARSRSGKIPKRLLGEDLEVRGWIALYTILRSSVHRFRRWDISERSVRRFNTFAKQYPVTLKLGERSGVGGHVELVPKDRTAVALVEFWDFWQYDGLGYLRVCSECSNWFADNTRNLSAKFCSRRC